jgi:hypothetical protein
MAAPEFGEKTAMHHRQFTLLSTMLVGALCGTAAAAEIKGAEILDHPCGKVAVKAMGLISQGKFEEVNKLSTKAMQDRWLARPEKERKMMAELAREMSPSEAEYTAMVKSEGLLVVDDKAGKLTVTRKYQDANGSGTRTISTKFAVNGSECLMD